MFLRVVGLLVAMALVQGCAAGAKPEAMSVGVSESSLITETSPLRNAVEVVSVSGGKETNPAWKSNISNEDFKSALEQSLDVNTILAKGDSRYKLDAELVEVKQPVLGGITMTVTTTVKYVLTNAATGASVSDKTVEASFKATPGDSMLGVQRLRLANEGSVRENIKQYIYFLVADSKANPAFKAAPAISMAQ